MASFANSAFASSPTSIFVHSSSHSLFLSSHYLANLCSQPAFFSSEKHSARFVLCTKAPTEQVSKPGVNCIRNKIPVQRRIPLLSTIYDLWARSIPTVRNGKRYGGVYVTSMIGSLLTILNDFDDISRAYKDGELFASGDANLPSFIRLFGETSLIVLEGKEHMKRRSMVQPAFSPQLFPLYFESIALASSQLWDYVSEQLKTHNSILLSNVLKQHYLRLIISFPTPGYFVFSVDTSGFKRLVRYAEKLWTLLNEESEVGRSETYS